MRGAIAACALAGVLCGLPLVGAAAGPEPVLPNSLSSRLLKKHVVVAYCFKSLPADPQTRPALLKVGVDNLRDRLPVLALDWPIKSRCGSVRHPFGPLKPPYTLLIATQTAAGNVSSILRLRVGAHLKQ
ncbi:MAG TPA: hypothetical protein VJ689_00880 [Gaiellaceae bacterium]|nr:hypothetical protein [Gaiellaceae bacterium]